MSSLFKTFAPEEASALMKRLEIHHPQKYGSWLNISEIELSAFTRQLIYGRRIGNLGTLRFEADRWERTRNCTQKSVDWQFTAQDARL